MAYFPDTMPRPKPTDDDKGFWEGAARRELRFQACADCGILRHPPHPICANCLSSRVDWPCSSGKGEIFSFTVVHHPSHPAVQSMLPYVVAVVTLDDSPGVRLVTNITDCASSDVHIGMRVALWWDDIGDMNVPRFTLEPSGAAGE